MPKLPRVSGASSWTKDRVVQPHALARAPACRQDAAAPTPLAISPFCATFPSPMPKVFLKTYGCQMNERDSEQVARDLIARGYEITAEETGADVVLLNTCSVRDMA